MIRPECHVSVVFGPFRLQWSYDVLPCGLIYHA